jgi:aspartate 1-decarboxylase
MLREMLKSKIHRAVVTGSQVDYIGSVEIDEDLMDAANILVGEKVLLVNLRDGARIETYAIKGKRGSGVMCVKGGAAIFIQKGDIVLVLTFCHVTEKEARKWKTKTILVDKRNKATKII